MIKKSEPTKGVPNLLNAIPASEIIKNNTPITTGIYQTMVGRLINAAMTIRLIAAVYTATGILISFSPSHSNVTTVIPTAKTNKDPIKFFFLI